MPIDGTTEGWTDGDLLRGDHHPGDHESDNRGNAKMDPLHAALFFNPCPENGTGWQEWIDRELAWCGEWCDELVIDSIRRSCDSDPNT